MTLYFDLYPEFRYIRADSFVSEHLKDSQLDASANDIKFQYLEHKVYIFDRLDIKITKVLLRDQISTERCQNCQHNAAPLCVHSNPLLW